MKSFALLALALAMPCAAQTWTTIGETEAGVMRMDLTTIRPQGRYMKAWSLWTGKNAVTTTGYPIFTYRAIKTLDYYDCKEETFAPKQKVFYEDDVGEGKIVYSYSATDERLNFEDPIPGTIGQSLLRRVCSNRR